MNEMVTIIRIKDMRLRTFIGIYEWEQKEKQDLILNLTLHCALSSPIEDGDIHQVVNYKNISKVVIRYIENRRFLLLEYLAAEVLKIIMRSDTRIRNAQIKVDKPGALRFCDSVSVTLSYADTDTA